MTRKDYQVVAQELFALIDPEVTEDNATPMDIGAEDMRQTVARRMAVVFAWTMPHFIIYNEDGQEEGRG